MLDNISNDLNLPTDKEKKKAWWSGFERAARMGARAAGKTPAEEEAFIDRLRWEFVDRIRKQEAHNKSYETSEREALEDG